MRARGQITINAPDKNYSVALIPSVTQIGCNSLGTPDPSSFEVKFQRITEGVVSPDSAYLAVYGLNSSGGWVLLNGSEVTTKRSVVTITVNMKYLQYTVKAHTIPDPAFDSLALAVVSVNVVKNGDNTTSGTMLRNCGELKIGEKYYWNSEYRDMGYFPNGGVNEIYVVNKFSVDGYVTSSPPENCGTGKDWKKGNKSDFSAFDLVVIDDAFIENLGVSTVKTKGKEGILNINGKDSFIEIESESKSKVFQFGVQNSNTGTNSPWAGLIMRQYLPYTDKDPNKMRGDSTLLPGTLWVSRISADVEHVGTPPVLIENSVTSYPNIESIGSGIIVRKMASINKKHNNVLQGLVAIVYCCTGEWTIYSQWSSSEYKHASNKLNIVFGYASIAPGKAEVKMQNCPFTHRDQYHVIATTNIPRGGADNGYVGIVDKVSDGFVIVTGTNTGLVNAQVTFFIIASDGYF